ncbi:MAG: hypothetical protein WC149_02550 [Arcobacteraceae bacterium]
MTEKINLNKLFKEVIKDLAVTNDLKQSLKNILIIQLGDFSENLHIDKLINKILIEQSLHEITNKEEIEDTLNNTLSNYNYQFQTEQIEIFKELIKYDYSSICENKKIFYKLNSLLANISLHLESLDKLYALEDKELHKKGIAKTPHPIIKDAITPRINHIKESIKYNPTASNELQLKIYNEFKNNPEEINLMFTIISLFGKEVFKNINSEILDTLFNQKVYLNSATKIEDYHIYTSCQITSFSIYKQDKILNERLVNYIDELLKIFFDEVFDKPLTRKHITKPIQFKSSFNGTLIYEYQTKKNYKENPIFKNV